VGLAFGVVVVIFIAAYIYTDNWPPVVLIESGSMEHADDDSTMRLDAIDTGDLVLVKAVDDRDDITTYLAGEKTDYQTYGDYGDVIVYDKNGQGGTPVIHRAMAWVDVIPGTGGSGTTYRIPGMNKTYSAAFGITILKIGADAIGKTDSKHGELKWSGFLTKGDSISNPDADQTPALSDIHGDPVQPVKMEFIMGKARGELPWMGMLKLCLTGQPGCDGAPSSQKTMMYTVIGLIVGLLVLLAVLPMLYSAPEDANQGRKDPRPRKSSRSAPHLRQRSTGPGKAGPGKGPPVHRRPPRRR